MSESKFHPGNYNISPEQRRSQDIKTGRLLEDGAFYDDRSLVVTEKQIKNAKKEMETSLSDKEKTELPKKPKYTRTRKTSISGQLLERIKVPIEKIQLLTQAETKEQIEAAIINIAKPRDKQFIKTLLTKYMGEASLKRFQSLAQSLAQSLMKGMEPTDFEIELFINSTATRPDAGLGAVSKLKPDLDRYDR